MACPAPPLAYQSPNPRDRFYEVCSPEDEQAIPFESVDFPFSRKILRQRRLVSYQHRAATLPNISNSAAVTKADFYRFEANYSTAPVRQEHFQLRHCLKVSSENQIYTTGPEEGEISVFDPLTQTSWLALSLSQVDSMRITSFDVAYPLIVSGGMNGQLYLDSMTGEMEVRQQLADPSLGHITNSVDFVNYQGSTELMVGSNNRVVSFFDPNILSTPKRQITAPDNVNKVALSPDQSLVAFVSDENPGRVFSTLTLQEVYVLVGHTDFGFGVDWHPTNPYQLVTGNQDRTYRIWDIRVADQSEVKPMLTLFGCMAPVLSTKFSSDGQFLVCAEAADFVHIVEAQLYSQVQEVDFFGEVMGVAFSREASSGESLYIGIQDASFASVREMRKRRRWGEEAVV